MPTNQPIFDCIMPNLVNGVLPKEFCLADFEGDEGIIHTTEEGTPLRLVDGFMDGIRSYHMGPPSLPEDIFPTLVSLIERACMKDTEAATEEITTLVNEYGVLHLIDTIQQAAMTLTERIDAPTMFSFAIRQLRLSTEKEMVKFALALMELFGEPDLDLKHIIHCFAACDEFTIFCCWNARSWENGNDEVFAMARHAHGWGRIHAVEQLDPATEKIRDWLFHEGIVNEIDAGYSAVTCYLKAQVAERLEEKMSPEDFAAATAIMTAGLADGPALGFLALPEPRPELERYIAQAGKQNLDDQACECVTLVKDAAEGEEWDDLANDCQALLESCGK